MRTGASIVIFFYFFMYLVILDGKDACDVGASKENPASGLECSNEKSVAALAGSGTDLTGVCIFFFFRVVLKFKIIIVRML